MVKDKNAGLYFFKPDLIQASKLVLARRALPESGYKFENILPFFR
jgi:hypothetical protein